MQAFGNDYVYIDAVHQTIEDPNVLARRVSDRHFGIGSDGLVLICPSEKGEFRMRMFNPDGTEGEMCGNALRSLSKYVYDHGMTEKAEFFIETLGGMQHVWLEVRDGKAINITADIGTPRLAAAAVPVVTALPRFVDQSVQVLDRTFRVTAMSWGNPHCVAFIQDTASFAVEKYGSAIEHSTALFPNKTNVTFAQVIDRAHIRIREWERGTGETLGCGTGCCTAAVAAVLLGWCDRRVEVEQLGGTLLVEWREQDDHVRMTGPIRYLREFCLMKLETMLRDLAYTLDIGTIDTEIASLVYDSRKVSAGSLFVCLTGFRSDGHDYIPAAVEAGAVAVVVERTVTVPNGVTVVRVEDSRYALALLSAAWFGHPAEKMTTVALTGTKGKTTTAHMLKSILEAAGHKVGMIGTIGAMIGSEPAPTKNTTPDSYELHALFARMVEAGCTHMVMEASSQGFKLHRTAGITFDVGVFLNLSPDHIGDGEHADFEEYLRCKSMLFRQCRRGLVNTDDEHWREVTAGAVCPLTAMSAAGAAADYTVSEARPLRRAGFLGSEFTVSGALRGTFCLNMPGSFNVANALAAAAAADLLGVSVSAIAEGLRAARVKGRTQVLDTPEHYTMLIDYAHNAASMENLLSMLRAYRPQRLICLFGGGGNRARMRRWDMGEISGKYADLTVLTMDNPRDEELDSINEDIKVGLAKYNGAYKIIPDRADAIRWVMDNAEEGDLIALIGKGHEEYQEIRGVKHFFSEEQVVHEHLAEK